MTSDSSESSIVWRGCYLRVELEVGVAPLGPAMCESLLDGDVRTRFEVALLAVFGAVPFWRFFVLCHILVFLFLCRVEPVAQFPAKGLTWVFLFLHHCSSVRCWASVTLRYGLAIFHVFLKWNAHFEHSYLWTLAIRGTLPSVFGVNL